MGAILVGTCGRAIAGPSRVMRRIDELLPDVACGGDANGDPRARASAPWRDDGRRCVARLRARDEAGAAALLLHHPHSRAATAVWMLEEVGVPYTLRAVDLMKGAQRQPEHRGLNPMGKVPVLLDGTLVVTETAAIGLYRGRGGAARGRQARTLRPMTIRWISLVPS